MKADKLFFVSDLTRMASSAADAIDAITDMTRPESNRLAPVNLDTPAKKITNKGG